MAQRTLTLRKETLTELSSAELGQVVGASGPTCGSSCHSDFQQCITGYGCLPTLNDCVITIDGTC